MEGILIRFIYFRKEDGIEASLVIFFCFGCVEESTIQAETFAEKELTCRDNYAIASKSIFIVCSVS